MDFAEDQDLHNTQQVKADAKTRPESLMENNVLYLSSVATEVSRLAYLLWLFSYSDITTFIVPCTTFGILGALSGPTLTTNQNPDFQSILSRAPAVGFFIWFNSLIFELANQRLPDAVIEDRLNKPWRPLPSGRITPVQTRRLLLAILPLFLAISYPMGVWKETALLFTLNWMYNDLQGGDEDFLLRNLIIAAAFGIYNKGALQIASGPGHEPTSSGIVWTFLVSCVIFSTMHIQDLKDQAGDRARGRSTAPIVMGDVLARWTVSVFIVFWSIFCAVFWDLPGLWGAVPIVPGLIVAIRAIWLREHDADTNTWIMWACWLSCLYSIPVVESRAGVLKWTS